jgi:pimeloyl-ACP methyl ester carboxylesterase
VDARRARIRHATGPVTFSLTATASERGASESGAIEAVLPVPLVVLPGLGNEATPGSFDGFALALDGLADGAYGFGAKDAHVVVHAYDSSLPLGALAADLDAAARRLVRGTVFAQVDVVGYSMGGLVARKWLAGAGKGRVRKLVFLGTPNEGAPIAFVLAFAGRTGALDTLLAGTLGGQLGGLAGAFVDEEALASLGVFYPTYPWATVRPIPFLPPTQLPAATLETLLSMTDTQLDELNAVAPDLRADIHAFFYTSVPTETFGVAVGTMDQVDLTGLLSGTTLDLTSVQDLTALASGSGDGVVPAHSVTMDEVPAWAARITPHDLGAGTHVTFALDARVYAGVLEVLAQ